MTSALNVGLVDSSTRASDVLVALGDAAATSAEEIAEAMQRSAASAQNVGLTYEQLATLITVVSARTRLSADTIGTSLQALFARMQNIRTSGYATDEDGTVTVTNDIIKAMNKLNAELGTNFSLVEQDGVTWRNLWDVLTEVAGAWDQMTDVQRSYLLTALAGSRQQDKMSNIIAGLAASAGSATDAFALLEVAMSSAGTTSEKFAIYQESVAAAQSNLTNAVDKLANSLGASEALKGGYNMLAGLVNAFADGTETLGKWSVTIPVVATGLSALASVFIKVGVSMKGAATAGA